MLIKHRQNGNEEVMLYNKQRNSLFPLLSIQHLIHHDYLLQILSLSPSPTPFLLLLVQTVCAPLLLFPSVPSLSLLFFQGRLFMCKSVQEDT